jgi:beta-carotene ketolase (CrtW type)
MEKRWMEQVIAQVREGLAGADKTRTTVIGVGLAVAVMLAWLGLHVYAVFFVDLAALNPLIMLALVAVLCWLYVGIFIVAHDCMHGTLAPGRPGVNRWFGRICLFLYAGFDFDALKAKHRDHHRHAGTEHDPDFHEDDPHSFWA